MEGIGCLNIGLTTLLYALLRPLAFCDPLDGRERASNSPVTARRAPPRSWRHAYYSTSFVDQLRPFGCGLALRELKQLPGIERKMETEGPTHNRGALVLGKVAVDLGMRRRKIVANLVSARAQTDFLVLVARLWWRHIVNEILVINEWLILENRYFDQGRHHHLDVILHLFRC